MLLPKLGTLPDRVFKQRNHAASQKRAGAHGWCLLPLCFGITVYLQARGAQAVDTVPVDIAFPGQKLIDRKIVELNYLLDRDPTPAHGLDYRRLTPYRPTLPERRQFRHPVDYIGPVIARGQSG